MTVFLSCDGFDTISDFKQCIMSGAEVEFCWKEIDYTITWYNGSRNRRIQTRFVSDK